MAKANDTWTVFPHGPIEKLDAGVWRVEGTLPNMPLKRVMAVAAKSTGELVVYSPIALDDTGMSALDALGRVSDIVVPNGMHRLDAKLYATRYPDARVLAPAGSLDKVKQVVDRATSIDAMPADPAVALSVMDGTKEREAIMTAGTTLVVADAIFNMPHLGGFQGFVLRRITKSTGGPCASRLARLLLINDKPAFAAHLERLATPTLARIVVGHHETITDHPADVLREVAKTLR